ncbi:hypothetical protein AX769_22170 (plasmid) [Frondihabitans sp. PAMC 28766]|uniref:hypothetical protein n=1 Tax=Frondihabitans sp. PAMC 28766 TaxID=1795630 RepID=UPI00078BD8DA|nr:hypothetical protein [Frondihabitans sp. PAMC 28766]AMM22839.1 hypothetical protein AX769_22170 [Frondihabitans sp. PAMC 28766]
MSKSSDQSVRQGAAAIGLEREVAAAEDGLEPAESSHEADPKVTDMDRLRTTIVDDKSRHGVWLRLAQYGPLPKRIALGIASSWRRSKPHLFGGDRHFMARIIPIVRDDSSHQIMTVRSETMYAVEVSYPHSTDWSEPSISAPE